MIFVSGRRRVDGFDVFSSFARRERRFREKKKKSKNLKNFKGPDLLNFLKKLKKMIKKKNLGKWWFSSPDVAESMDSMFFRVLLVASVAFAKKKKNQKIWPNLT